MLKDIDIDDFLSQDFDILLDARNPKNYEISHIPNAINFYALDDYEYAKTGIMYKKNKFNAKFYSAARVCENISKQMHKLNHLNSGAKIGIYCARGGMRSGSIACVFDMIGFRVYKLIGGYKSYRNKVLNYFSDELNIKFITLFSHTGCGKSKILRRLDELGYPVVDIERLANHLGSIFGDIYHNQPNQKKFENELFSSLMKFKDKFVFIEGESARLGHLIVPKSLNSSLHNPALSIYLKANIDYRVDNIISDYKIIDDKYFFDCIKKITPFIKKDFKDLAIAQFEDKNYKELAKNLLINYYDIVYKKPAKIDKLLEISSIDEAVDMLIKIYENL